MPVMSIKIKRTVKIDSVVCTCVNMLLVLYATTLGSFC